jgi:hypothetical protein
MKASSYVLIFHYERTNLGLILLYKANLIDQLAFLPVNYRII